MSIKAFWRMDRLIALREKHGWSQRELGRQSGITETMIARYERGFNDPSVPALLRLTETFGVSADYLLGTTDDPRGHVGDGQMSDDERAMLEAFRRDGWRGVIRVVAERIP